MREVKIGIAGLGRLGLLHAEHIAHHIPYARLTAACRNNPARIQSAKEALGIEHVYDSFEAMLKYGDIDAVVIVSASGAHSGQLVAALEKGKHVFCEKPLGLTMHECLLALEAAKAHPALVCMLGFMRRFDPSYVYAKEKIASGAIGMPYLVKSYSADPMASVSDYISAAGGQFGGLFVDLGIHDMDLMCDFLGETPTGVLALGGSYQYPSFEERGDAEAGVATYTFPGNKMAVLHAGRAAAHGYHVETEIIGTTGSIRVGAVPQKNLATLYNASGVVTECMQSFPERFVDAYRLELQAFVDCIREKRLPPVTVHDGLRAFRIAEATVQSFREKAFVSID